MAMITLCRLRPDVRQSARVRAEGEHLRISPYSIKTARSYYYFYYYYYYYYYYYE